MIAKSDLIILVVSSTLLGVAVYRWDQNTRNVNTSTVLANTTVAASTPPSDSDLVSTASTSIADPILDNSNITDARVDTPTTVVVTEPLVVESASPFLTHVVRSGDSLSEIAATYNTSVQALRDANGISGSTIYIGQEILYPASQ